MKALSRDCKHELGVTGLTMSETKYGWRWSNYVNYCKKCGILTKENK